MSGHSHWSGIKHKKEAADQKRAKIFSKLLAAVSIAAKEEPNPEFNPRLRAAIEKARKNNVPNENIKKAIKHGSSSENKFEDLLIEAYGPGGAAIIITAITDNKNRTIAEIKKIINSNNAKLAESGSVKWAFEKNKNNEWEPKFKQKIPEADKDRLEQLIGEIKSHSDVQDVFVNSE